mmetsp:Transcript_44605/g.105762  ORF Transcript_44605/g.105762 Transcript_44605/m.105762 type:complete len:180 (-) Transcript_44605:87-626(-)
MPSRLSNLLAGVDDFFSGPPIDVCLSRQRAVGAAARDQVAQEFLHFALRPGGRRISGSVSLSAARASSFLADAHAGSGGIKALAEADKAMDDAIFIKQKAQQTQRKAEQASRIAGGAVMVACVMFFVQLLAFVYDNRSMTGKLREAEDEAAQVAPEWRRAAQSQALAARAPPPPSAVLQ